MRIFLARKRSVLTAISGIAAGLAILGANPAAQADGPGPQTRQTGDKTTSVRDEPPPAGLGAGADDNDVVQRLRDRRRAEEAGKATGAARSESDARAASRQEKVRGPNLTGRAFPAPAKAPKATFLGIEASPAPVILTHQLDLPNGFGLAVDEVAPGSPAEAAGIKRFDLLQKLDDQLLVDDRQLTALVRSHKPGDQLTLAVIRQGKPLTLKATLSQHEEIAEGDGPEHFMLQFDAPPGMPGLAGLPAPDGVKVLVRKPLPPAAAVPQAKPAPPDNAGASTGLGTGADNADVSKQLEQELRSLRATADELRARLKRQQEEEAQEQKQKGLDEKSKEDGK